MNNLECDFGLKKEGKKKKKKRTLFMGFDPTTIAVCFHTRRFVNILM